MPLMNQTILIRVREYSRRKGKYRDMHLSLVSFDAIFGHQGI